MQLHKPQEERIIFIERLLFVSKLFDQIESVSGRNQKENLLMMYHDTEFLKKILLYTYNPYYVYGINKKTFERQATFTSNFTDVFELCDHLKGTKGTTDNIKEGLRYFVQEFSESSQNLLQRIILKDLKIGINIETINKVFPKLIPTFKVQLCHTYESEKDLRGTHYIVQPKLDGVRCIAIVKDGGVELYSRNGTRISGYDEIESALLSGDWEGHVLDGEIMGENFDKIMNDLFSLETKKKAKYFIFDCIPIDMFFERKCTIPYIERYNYYRSNCDDKDEDVLVGLKGGIISRDIFSGVVNDLNKEYVSNGYEGCVVKDTNGLYEFKRSFSWLKYKAMMTDEFYVVAFKEGQGKYLGTLGAITIDTKDGVLVDVGSGFSDEQRDEIWNNQGKYAGQMVEVKFQEYTKDGSLRFPTFIVFRNDK